MEKEELIKVLFLNLKMGISTIYPSKLITNHDHNHVAINRDVIIISIKQSLRESTNPYQISTGSICTVLVLQT